MTKLYEWTLSSAVLGGMKVLYVWIQPILHINHSLYIYENKNCTKITNDEIYTGHDRVLTRNPNMSRWAKAEPLKQNRPAYYISDYERCVFKTDGNLYLSNHDNTSIHSCRHLKHSISSLFFSTSHIIFVDTNALRKTVPRSYIDSRPKWEVSGRTIKGWSQGCW